MEHAHRKHGTGASHAKDEKEPHAGAGAVPIKPGADLATAHVDSAPAVEPHGGTPPSGPKAAPAVDEDLLEAERLAGRSPAKS